MASVSAMVASLVTQPPEEAGPPTLASAHRSWHGHEHSTPRDQAHLTSGSKPPLENQQQQDERTSSGDHEERGLPPRAIRLEGRTRRRLFRRRIPSHHRTLRKQSTPRVIMSGQIDAPKRNSAPEAECEAVGLRAHDLPESVRWRNLTRTPPERGAGAIAGLVGRVAVAVRLSQNLSE
mgnify:CR=1 FL=1